MLGSRIKRARKALGLSLRDLGKKVALSHTAIQKYEDNKATPSSDVLIKLAKALNVKVAYFFRPETFHLENIQYRKHSDMPKKHLNEINAIILDQVERRIELESLFPNPPLKSFSIKGIPNNIDDLEQTEKISENIRNYWALGMNPVPDLIDLFESKGIKVFEIDAARYSKFDGLYAKVKDIPVIVISNNIPGDRQRFTLAHELGHLLFDDKVSPSVDIEQFCNRFAGAFLLPKQSLIDILGAHRNHLEPYELGLMKKEFGISMTSILHRAKEANIISERIYREIRATFNAHGWDKKEPGEQYPVENAHIFDQMIFHALAEEYIGESKAAELMGMRLEKLRALRAMECQNDGDSL